MSRVVNISEKLSNELPFIQVGEKKYPVRDGIDTVTKFQELTSANNMDAITGAIKDAIGKAAYEEIKAGRNLGMKNLRVLTIAIFAAMFDIEYEAAEGQFQRANTARE